MSEELVAEFIVCCKAALRAGRPGISQGAWRLEMTVLQLLIRLGRAAMVELFKDLGTGYRGAKVKRRGRRYHFVGHRRKTLHGLFGVVPYKRAYYAASEGGRGWAPLDEELAIKGGHTAGCQYFLSRFAAHQAHAESVRQFHEVFRADEVELLSEKKAFAVVREVTAGLERQRQQEISDYREAGVAPAVQEPICGTVAVCIDAGKVPVRANERVDDGGKKKYEREYRDAKVATVGAVEWNEQRREAQCSKVSYVAGSEHADRFFPRIEVELKRRSEAGEVAELVVLADGAAWIWDRVATLAEPGQRVWYILDYWHACEHLATVSRSVYGEGSERGAESLRRWQKLLRGSRVATVIEELVKLRDGGGLSAGTRHELQGQINYFKTNQGRMDYRRYRKRRLPIGSGTVESACKNVVGGRMKGSGMIWSLLGAQGMLQLCASVKSGRFRSDYERLLAAAAPPEDLPMAA